ncbi:MAG: hypothetical protein Q9M36_01300 [Sulfurovum sp.]|nr:hypothetical protein [Sulfurovum sp.]
MNQTKKRLNIIKLAISISDIETIQIQILKLAPMNMDASIQEIIALLQEGSYVKAHSLISTYIEVAPDEIIHQSIQTTSLSPSSPVPLPPQQDVIDEFELFITPPPPSTQTHTQMDAKDFDILLHDENKENDAFFENATTTEEEMATIEEVSPKEEIEIEEDSFFEETVEETKQEEPKEAETEIEKEEVEETVIDKNEEDYITEETPTSRQYEAIPHITQKLIHMEKRYPPHKVSSSEKFETV